MAYYDEAYVDRINLIKELQAKRFLPLSVIKKILKEERNLSVNELRSIMELDGKIFKTLNYQPESRQFPAEDVVNRYKVPKSDLLEMEKSEIINPRMEGKKKYYLELDVRIIECWEKMRNAGFTKRLGFSVKDIVPHKQFISMLVDEEARTFLKRTSGKVSTQEMVKMVDSALVILNELVTLIRRKLLAEFVHHYAKDVETNHE